MSSQDCPSLPILRVAGSRGSQRLWDHPQAHQHNQRGPEDAGPRGLPRRRPLQRGGGADGDVLRHRHDAEGDPGAGREVRPRQEQNKL